MWTEFSITIYVKEGAQGNLQLIADEAFAAIDVLEERINNWTPESQLSRINAEAGKHPVPASQDIIDLINTSKVIHATTEGTFDVTVGPLLKLYGFYKKEGRRPTQPEIEKALALVGLDMVTVDDARGTISFAKDGMLIDFGGIGKGLAVDQAAQVLRNYGITSALVNGGTSSLVAIGAPPGEAGWSVNIRHPDDEHASIDRISIKDESVSISGCYGAQLEAGGKRLCHTFDPRTGQPVEGMLTVAVVGKTGTETDALDNAFMVLGPEKIRAYCKDHPETRAIIVPAPPSGKPVSEHVNFP